MTKQPSEFRALTACTAGVCLGNIGWWIQPQLISDLVAKTGLSEAQSGLVSSVELAALALSTVLLPRLFQRVALRWIALSGALLAIGATAVSIAVTDFHPLLWARACAGLGEGAAFMAGNAAAARFADPDRAFGKINFANVVFGILLVTAEPWFGSMLGRTAALPALLTSLVVLTPILLLLPLSFRVSAAATIDGASQVSAPARSYRTLGLIGSFFLVTIISAAIWGFYGLIGAQAGLADADISKAIGSAALAGLAGSVVVPLIGNSFGRVLPVTAAVALLAGAIVVLCLVHQPLAFRIAACVNVGANYMLLPYYFAAAAEEDVSGAAVAAIGGTFLIVGAIGPYLGGLLMQTLGLGTMASLVVITCALALGLFVAVDAKTRKRKSANEEIVECPP